jgi:hypothetical protein
MNEVVYGLLAHLAKKITMDKGKISPPKIINRKEFTQSYHRSEESNTGWSLYLSNTLPREKGRLSRLSSIVIALHFKNLWLQAGAHNILSVSLGRVFDPPLSVFFNFES